MKTLDEVIEKLEFATRVSFGCVLAKNVEVDDLTDALHYLKIFQAHEKRVREQLDDLKEEYRPNDPLTWDELKSMEGKPVWVEIGNGSKGWVIIRKINDNGIVTGSDGFIGIADVYGEPTTWQAYRKERS